MSRAHKKFVFSPETVSSMVSAMLGGLRYSDYWKSRVNNGLGVPGKRDWKRVETVFVGAVVRLYHKMLSKGWDVVRSRDLGKLGAFDRLVVGCDGFWQKPPKKNHCGNSDHGSFVVWDMISNLILFCGTVSKLDDSMFEIPGVDMSSQDMEAFLFGYFLATIRAVGATIAYICKDGDIGAPTVIYKFLGKTGLLIACWMHRLRTLWKKIKDAGKRFATKENEIGKERCKCAASVSVQ